MVCVERGAKWLCCTNKKDWNGGGMIAPKKKRYDEDAFLRVAFC